MAILRTLITSVTAKTTNFERGMKRSKKSTETFASSVRKASGAIKGFAAVAAVGGAAAFTAYIKRSIDAADAVAKLSLRLGIGTEDLQKLQFAAERSGLGLNLINLGLQRMTRRLAEASVGTGEAQKAIKELNLDAQVLNRLPLAKQFETIAQKLREIKNPADRVRLAFKFFDSEAVGVLQMVDDLEMLKKAAEGRIFSQTAIDNSTAFKDVFTDLSGTIKGFASQFIEKAVPKITSGIEQLDRVLQKGSEAIKKYMKAENDFLIRNVFGIPQGTIDEFDRKNQLLVEKKKRRGEVVDPSRILPSSGPGAVFPKNQTLETRGPVFDNPELRALRETKTAIQELSTTGVQLSSTLSNSFEGFITGAQTAKEAVQSLAQELLLLTARQAFIEPAAEATAGFIGRVLGNQNS